jgi:HPt (histidine-containing phosphotransfer) domain-containing protein
MLDSVPLYLEKTAEALLRLRQAVSASDFREMHEAMHSLLGMSGDVGAQALHRVVKRYYPVIAAGAQPADADWFVRIEHVHAATAQALQARVLAPGVIGNAAE